MAEYLISLSLLICAVLLIRGIFRRTISPRAVYALWLVVVIRLFLPIALFEVDVALPEFAKTENTEQSEAAETMDTHIEPPKTSNDNTVQAAPTSPIHNTTPITPVVPETNETGQSAPIMTAEPEQIDEQANETIDLTRIAGIVWLSGSSVVAVWFAFTSISFSYRLRKDRKMHRMIRKTKVYISEGAGVPCIAGLIPSIYITPQAANSTSETLIIIHEYTHLRHGDHIWAFVRALALIMHWWNPLVWIAASVSKQDAELACDDAIAAKLNDETRLKYAHILLDTIPQKHRYAVGFGSAPMKERILMLTKKQKNRWICLVLAAVLAVSAVGCSFVSLNEKVEEVDPSVGDTTPSANEQNTPEISEDAVDEEIIEYTLKLAKYFRDPVASAADLREHQSLWEFLVNSIYELHEKEIVTLADVTEKEWYPQYHIPYSYMQKAAALLLGIEDGLPENLLSEDYYWSKDIDAFLYSPFSAPMFVTECIRSEIDEDGLIYVTVRISRVEEKEALSVNTYTLKPVDDPEFGTLYQLLSIVQETGDDVSTKTLDIFSVNYPVLADLLSMTVAKIQSTYGEMTFEYSENGGSPVYSIEKQAGVQLVYNGSDVPTLDERVADELILTAAYNGNIEGIAVGMDMADVPKQIVWDDAWFSLNQGVAGLQKEFDGFTLTLTIACEIGTTPTEENTTEEWNVWQEQYRENPTGQIVALRLKVRNGNTPTLSIQYDVLRETMDKIVAADTISTGSYLINVEGLSTPVLLHMDCDRVVAIEAYGHYVELASALRACGNGNYDFSFFEADGAIVLEGGSYNIDTIYILAPEASSVILPGEAASYCLWLDEEGKLKYRYTHNEIASIIQCGALSVATAYDEFLYAVGDAKIVNGEVVFSDQSESYVMSDKYDLKKEFEQLYKDSYDSIEDVFESNRGYWAGEWYYSFVDNSGAGFYRFGFETETMEMHFDYGYFESEYVNRYTGNYTLNESGVYSAALHDNSVLHTNPDIKMTFTLTNLDSKNKSIVFTMLSCDVERYKPLTNTQLICYRELPSFTEWTAVDDGDFLIYTVRMDAGADVVIRIPKEWYWGGYDFVEDSSFSSAYPTLKRVGIRRATETQQEFTAQLSDVEEGYRQYEMDDPITGQTDAGYSYIGYYGDDEQIKGLRERRYLFYITTDINAYVLEIRQHIDHDGDNFIEEILNPILKSFEIQ